MKKGTTKVVPRTIRLVPSVDLGLSPRNLYSIIPARASSDFTAIRCSTLRLCSVLSSTPLSSFSLPASSQLLARIADTIGGKRLPRHPRRLRFQVRVGFFQLGHPLLQMSCPFAPRRHLIRRPLFHRRHNPVHLRVQRFLLRVQPSQHTIQRFGRTRQPLRRRRQLLHHFFIHALLLLGVFTPLKPCSLAVLRYSEVPRYSTQSTYPDKPPCPSAESPPL